MRQLSETDATIPVLPCACASLRRAARAVTQVYDQELAAMGLNAPQFTLLQALARTGAITQGRLGARLALESTTLSRTLKPLEQARWIRSRPGDDRRERHLDLTAAGRAQLERATTSWTRAQDRIRAGIGEAEWGRLLNTLATVARAAQQA